MQIRLTSDRFQPISCVMWGGTERTGYVGAFRRRRLKASGGGHRWLGPEPKLRNRSPKVGILGRGSSWRDPSADPSKLGPPIERFLKSNRRALLGASALDEVLKMDKKKSRVGFSIATVAVLAILSCWVSVPCIGSTATVTARTVAMRADVLHEEEAGSVREAAAARLKGMGFPASVVRDVLDEAERRVQEGRTSIQNVDLIEKASTDPEVRAKALNVIENYEAALLAGAGQPPGESHTGRQLFLDLLDDEERAAAPAAGGYCMNCPSVNYGTFTPTPSFQTHSASLASYNDCNNYSFSVVAGTVYEWTTCAPGGGGFDTMLDLFASSCSLMTSVDDSCGLLSRITWTATYTGTVRLRVRGYGGSFGSYTLAFRSVGSNSCQSCASPGSSLISPSRDFRLISGATSTSCPSRFHSVYLSAGHSYIFSMCSGTAPCTTGNYDTRLRIYNGNCQVVADNDDSCNLLSHLSYTASASGWHRIEVTGFTPSNVGSYTFAYRETTTIPRLLCPLEGGCTVGGFAFGDAWTFNTCPASGGYKKHVGADLRASAGTTVRAAEAGTVRAFVDLGGCWGREIILEHTNPAGGRYVSAYQHVLPRVGLSVGSTVSRGDPIGTVKNLTGCGSTGDNSHLHFGTWAAPYDGTSEGGRGALPNCCPGGTCTDESGRTDTCFPTAWVNPMSVIN